MTHETTQLKAAYRASGLAFLGITFEKAMTTPLIRMGLQGVVRAKTKKQGKPAPVQPALI